LVVPVFNEEEVLDAFVDAVRARLGTPLLARGDEYELLFVDDGSTDRSVARILDLRGGDPGRIKLVALSRNFGHQIAITAGIDHACGDTVTILDADLQDPPELVLELIDRWRDGFDVVYAQRTKREGEGAFKRLTAAVFYRALSRSSPIRIPLDAGDFRLMSRRAADAVRRLGERHRFMRGLTSWVGFRQTAVPYVRAPRHAGATKFPLRRMLRFAWDAFTGFSFFPLRLAIYSGLLASAASVGLACWALWVRLFTDRAVQGWTSLMVVVLFLGGVQLFTIGVMGEYVARIFEESKRRPLYFVDRTEGVAPAPRDDSRPDRVAADGDGP